MKGFWADFFFDIHECEITEEDAASRAGKSIRADLDRIEAAILNHDLRRALGAIQEAKDAY